MTNIRRRDLLAGTAIAMLGDSVSRATTITGGLPWKPGAGDPPPVVPTGAWKFFQPAEAARMEVIADRIIPPDPQTPGGNDAGCVVFIDRQLAGAYGESAGLYRGAPFVQGEKSQGPQSSLTPGRMYRAALAGLESHCQSVEHRSFVAMAAERQDAILHGIEDGSVALEGIDGKDFFTVLLKDMQEGFFSDPIYGGNRDMCAWKMIGYPGAHYDYRDWVGRHNERYPYAPVSITGRAEWNPKKV